MPDVVVFSEVQEFFVEKWAPHVVDLHSGGGGILASFFMGVCTAEYTLSEPDGPVDDGRPRLAFTLHSKKLVRSL